MSSKTQPPPARRRSGKSCVLLRSLCPTSRGSIARPVRELLDFLVYNKAWWLTPIIIVLLLVGILIVLGSTGLAPFIYPLF